MSANRLLPRTLAIGSLLLSCPLLAGPWLDAEPALRSDLQQLAKLGIIRTPLMTWPLSVGSLKADMARYPLSQVPSSVLVIYKRVYRRLEREAQSGVQTQSRVEWANQVRQGQGFAALPKRAAFAGGASYLNDWFAGRLSVNRILSPKDQKETRLDDSYVALSAGNWMVAAGKVRRFWGPQWQQSWALDNLEQPLDALWLSRNQSLDQGIGPWGINLIWSRTPTDIDGRRAQFSSARLDWRPQPQLELATNAQWQSQSAWGTTQKRSSESEQRVLLWGSDFRWQSLAGPALYGQWQQFRDEQGSIAAHTAGLDWQLSSESAANLRWYLEYSRQPQENPEIDGYFVSQHDSLNSLTKNTSQVITLGNQINLADGRWWQWSLQRSSILQTTVRSDNLWQAQTQHQLPCFGFSCRFSLDWRQGEAKPWGVGVVWVAQ